MQLTRRPECLDNAIDLVRDARLPHRRHDQLEHDRLDGLPHAPCHRRVSLAHEHADHHPLQHYRAFFQHGGLSQHGKTKTALAASIPSGTRHELAGTAECLQ